MKATLPQPPAVASLPAAHAVGAGKRGAAMAISRCLRQGVRRLFVAFQWATVVLVLAVGWTARPQPIEQLIPWEKNGSAFAGPRLIPANHDPFAVKALPAPRREKPVNFPAQPASSSPATPAGVAVDRPVRRVRSARPGLCAQDLSRGGAVCGVFSETAPEPHCAQVRMPVETCASRSWCRPVKARNAIWLARFQQDPEPWV